MAYDLLASVTYAEENALGQSIGRCARYVKKALAAGGIELQCVHAQNCSAGLEAQGFDAVMNQNTDTGTYEKGDVVVIEGWADPDGDGPKKGNPSGHMAIWNGEIWLSDFKQSKAVYPGPGYRANKPPYKIYRAKK
jgi:hypothetical protein